MVRVFINGYGNIGKRLASAFSHDKEIQFVGIGKYSIDDRVDEAFAKKFAVYVPEQKIPDFRQKGYDISGTISDAVKESDLVIDAAKDGFGYTNKVNFYIPMNKSAIFQGGEDRTGEKKLPTSFTIQGSIMIRRQIKSMLFRVAATFQVWEE